MLQRSAVGALLEWLHLRRACSRSESTQLRWDLLHGQSLLLRRIVLIALDRTVEILEPVSNDLLLLCAEREVLSTHETLDCRQLVHRLGVRVTRLVLYLREQRVQKAVIE